MTHFALSYAATALVFFAIDFLWLGVIAKGFYRTRMAHLLAENFNVAAILAFYALYVAGIVLFAVRPALSANGNAWALALGQGALFGFFCYATYNFTNWATLKDWPVTVTMVDLVWGTALTGLSALGGYLIARQVIGA